VSTLASNLSHSLSSFSDMVSDREAALAASTEAKLAAHADATAIQLSISEESLSTRVKGIEDKLTSALDDIKHVARGLFSLQVDQASSAAVSNITLSRLASIESDIRSLTHSLTHTALTLFSNATSLLMSERGGPSPPQSTRECISESRVREIVQEMMAVKV